MTLKLTLSTAFESFTHHSEGQKVVIGRSMKCDFAVPKEDLSREHCLVEVSGQDIYVTDLGSKNGVSVNGVKLDPNARKRVNSESGIALGPYQLKVSLFEIRTKADLALPKTSTGATPKLPGEITAPIQLEIPKERTAKFLVKRAAPKKAAKEGVQQSTSENYEAAKMIIAFVVVIGFLLYQFLGR